MQNMCVLFESEVTGAADIFVCVLIPSRVFSLFFSKGAPVLPVRFTQSITTAVLSLRRVWLEPFDAPNHNTMTPVSAPRSESRFDGQHGSITEMVDFLINREAGLIKMGYHDYRGISVAGAGRWIDEMELGVIIEQDVAEAMAPYLASRNIIIGLSVCQLINCGVDHHRYCQSSQSDCTRRPLPFAAG